VASYDLRPGNGAGLFSNKKISNEVKKKEQVRRAETYDVNKQTTYSAEINKWIKGAVLLPGARTGPLAYTPIFRCFA